nr:hypothetical protein CFP56_21001 [Quercus suber]
MVFGKKSSTEKVDPPHTPDSGNVDMVEKMEPKDHGASGFAAYGHDHLHPTLTQAEQDDMNPNVHNKVRGFRSFLDLPSPYD